MISGTSLSNTFAVRGERVARRNERPASLAYLSRTYIRALSDNINKMIRRDADTT